MSDHIGDLRAALADASDRVEALKSELHDALCERAGVKVGDVVRITRGKHVGREALVREVEPWERYTRLKGSLRRKDGEWSSVIRYIGSGWERIESPPDNS